MKPNEPTTAVMDEQVAEPGRAGEASGDDAAGAEAGKEQATYESGDRHLPGDGWLVRLVLRLERKISRLSVRNNFWHRVCSWIWLPLAYRSGIKMKRVTQEGSEETFSAVLPFRRFNRNWYNAMAGAALLGNSEVAGGMYVFGRCGADYTVVCKHLDYRFLRPCFGPAQYRVEPKDDLDAKLATGGEFNITLEMTVVQLMKTPGDKERRVGRCTATFHVTPKRQARQRRVRRPIGGRRRG